MDMNELMIQIREWARELGFAELGVRDTQLHPHDRYLQEWLARGDHGDMAYMAQHGAKRWEPDTLVPGTRRVISVRMNYLPKDAAEPLRILNDPQRAYVSRYALGRDYHKLLRQRLAALAKRIQQALPDSQHRVFTDSAPVLERAVAEGAGLGWIGKNTMLISPRAGSWFFLGEIYTDLLLPVDPPFTGFHCGTCDACLVSCPTDAFRGPNQLDARRCISYLTIELKGSIPEELRPLIGNRIYGCDDCQLVCPWNKFAPHTDEADFGPRNDLDQSDLLTLFDWSEDEFLRRTEGSPIRRIGYLRWLRNIAVGIGNGPASPAAIAALEAKRHHSVELVREHVEWALVQIRKKCAR
jgi:epoxyqueuosine reductase